MNNLEMEETIGHLGKVFPRNSLQPDELALFDRTFRRFRKGKVIDAIDRYRSTTKVSVLNPAYGAISEHLSEADVDNEFVRSAAVAQPRQYVTGVAAVLVREHPHLAGLSESEILMRYHRVHWRKWYGATTHALTTHGIELSEAQRQAITLQRAAVMRRCSIDVGEALDQPMNAKVVQAWAEAAVAEDYEHEDKLDAARRLGGTRPAKVTTQDDLY